MEDLIWPLVWLIIGLAMVLQWGKSRTARLAIRKVEAEHKFGKVTQAHDFFKNSFLQDALTTAFWLWLGITAARFITHDAFEGRPPKLTILNVSHEFVTFMVMALIIGVWQ